MNHDLGYAITWAGKVEERAKDYLSPAQKKNLNDDIVELIHNKYLSLLSSGAYQKINFAETLSNIGLRKWDANTYKIINYIKNELNLNIIIVDAVFRAIWELAINGKISYSKLDPVGVQQDKINSDPLKDKTIIDTIQKSFNFGKISLVSGIALVSIYLLAKGK